jgi:hypothetical protein
MSPGLEREIVDRATYDRNVYTWVEQQGSELADFDARCFQACWDGMIGDFYGAVAA